MSFYFAHIKAAAEVIKHLKHGMPLALQLQHFFAKNKKYGSKDRKSIATICYQYFRVGKAFKSTPIEEKIVLANYLCSSSPNQLLASQAPALNETVQLDVAAKCQQLGIALTDIFAFNEMLGAGIDSFLFAASLLQQPAFFIRVRPQWHENVTNKLKANAIAFNQVNDDAIELPQGTKIEPLLSLNKEAVVQDLSSQQVFNYLKQHPLASSTHLLQIWDCCAASGGKSILMADVLQRPFHLLATDVRASILNNLKQRFKEAGLKNYETKVIDATVNTSMLADRKFDIIICDTPCSGSGTWSRTPEQMHFFENSTLQKFTALQLKIASQAIQHLQKGGLFFYITCSVFAQENENIVTELKQKFHLQLLQMEYIKGYQKQADSMFVAVFTV
ncbi:methyltransferase domain-containing protein [Ferruginibacter yonginensis]|uniref:Methyltransferase domain-containing protein n=1 Tax=Ferruginibacter yonginensis TaxID=1310416 RepID=A0ABV8QQY5_9BACT